MARIKKHTEKKLPRPVAPVARAGITAGGFALYHAQDKLLANRRSRKAFQASKPDLSAVQSEIVEGLRTRGLATCQFSELVGEEALWQELSSQARELAERGEEKLKRIEAKQRKAERRGETWTRRHKAKGDFLLRAYERGAAFTPDDPWLRFGTSDLILGIVDSAMGLRAKLVYVDQWYTLPAPEGADPIGSQTWHRDFDDRYLIKIFMYFNNVDEGAGPFQYIPGSAPGGPYGDVYRWRPMGKMYPPQNKLRERIDETKAVTLTGPPGTMIFCNSSGFHRGGFAKSSPRLSAIFNYVSPAALESVAERQFTVETGNGRSEMSDAALYAVT